MPLANVFACCTVQSGPAHIEAFLSVLKGVTKEETTQYVLALLLQLLQGNANAASCCSMGMLRCALFLTLLLALDPWTLLPM